MKFNFPIAEQIFIWHTVIKFAVIYLIGFPFIRPNPENISVYFQIFLSKP